jgi:hypothetical protein
MSHVVFRLSSSIKEDFILSKDWNWNGVYRGEAEDIYRETRPIMSALPFDDIANEKAVYIKFGKQGFEVSCPPSLTVGALLAYIEGKTGIAKKNQKVLYKGKALHSLGSDTLILPVLKIKGKTVPKLNLIGSTTAQISQAKNGSRDDPLLRNDMDLQTLRAKPWVVGKRRVRQLRPKEYGFQSVEALSQFEDGDVAEAMLWTLANNPGVQKVMEKYRWKVPVLKEMMPEGKVGVSEVCLMGLNVNKGAEILLRIRTDDLKGFRKIESVFDVLYHELAHNEISEHNSDFKALNSLIKKQCRELDWTKSRGHRLGDSYSDGRRLTREEAVARMLGGKNEAETEEERLKRTAAAKLEKLAPEVVDYEAKYSAWKAEYDQAIADGKMGEKRMRLKDSVRILNEVGTLLLIKFDGVTLHPNDQENRALRKQQIQRIQQIDVNLKEVSWGETESAKIGPSGPAAL